MNTRSCLLALVLSCSLSAAFAQKNLVKAGEKLWPARMQKTVAEMTASSSLKAPLAQLSAVQAVQFSQRLVGSVHVEKPLFRSPVLQPFEQHIHHFIFTVSARDAHRPFKGSGFVFAEEYQGKTVLWGATAAHIARAIGKEVTVTFHVNGQEVSFPAEVVLTGRKYGLNAALIKLPPEAFEAARPVVGAHAAPEKGAPLFTYGFSAGQYKKTLRRVITANTERVVADFPRLNTPKPGFCGSLVVNAEGQAVGIEVGGYAPEQENLQWYHNRRHATQRLPQADLSRISEVVPFVRLYDLLKEYRQPGSAARVMLFDGILVGKLHPDEFIESITVRYQNGSHKLFMRNPFFDLSYLNALFDLHGARQAQIIISKGRTHRYSYFLDLEKRTAEKTGAL